MQYNSNIKFPAILDFINAPSSNRGYQKTFSHHHSFHNKIFLHPIYLPLQSKRYSAHDLTGTVLADLKEKSNSEIEHLLTGAGVKSVHRASSNGAWWEVRLCFPSKYPVNIAI